MFTLIACFVPEPENPEYNEENITIYNINKLDISEDLIVAKERREKLITTNKNNQIKCRIPSKYLNVWGVWCNTKYIRTYIEELKKNDNFIVVEKERNE